MQESGRFFEKKLRKKLLLLQTVAVSTPVAPGQTFFGVAFFQKSDRLLVSYQRDVRSAVAIAARAFSYRLTTAFLETLISRRRHAKRSPPLPGTRHRAWLCSPNSGLAPTRAGADHPKGRSKHAFI
jgi:hypothetical protein